MRDRMCRAVQWALTPVALAAAMAARAQAPVAPPPAAPPPPAQTAPVQVAQLQVTHFDEDVLRQRGLAPSIGDYFRRAPRFTPGPQPVQVIVNGQELGGKQATFDTEGRLCFTPEFVRSIGIVPAQKSTESGAAPPGACPGPHTVSPRAVVALLPGQGMVEIAVPEELVQRVPRAYKTDSGGRGALLNYRAFTQAGESGGSVTHRYRHLDTTVGANVDDWLVRSQQSWRASSAAGEPSRSQFRWQSAYAQKTFEDARQVLQAGRITTQDPLFGGIPLDGVQWFPEQALVYKNSTYAVTGAAASRARVEIRQAGALLHTTVVPPGPFSIASFPLANRGADLQVKVVEDGGAEQNFVVPAAQLLLAGSQALNEGWNVSAGRLWDQTDARTYRSAPVVSASRGWAVGAWSGQASGLVSRDYAAVGAAANFADMQAGRSLYGQLLAAHDGQRGNLGVQGSAAFGQSLGLLLAPEGAGLVPGSDVRLGLSGSARTAGYRTLQEAQAYQQRAPGVASGSRSQLGATLGWSAGWLGSFSLGATREYYFQGEPGDYLSLGWNKGWRNGVNLSLNLSRSVKRGVLPDPFNAAGGTGITDGKGFAYLSLSIPLGEGISSRSFAQKTDNETRYGTSLTQRVNEFMGYTASVEHQERSLGADTSTSSITASLLPRYTNVSLGLTKGRGYGSYYGEVSGAVMATDAGVAFSPYAVQDSFAMVKTGDVTGVRIETPQGPVWSGPGGLAAVPALAPYAESRIEVATRSVALDVEVDNGLQVVQAARGAVLKLDMGARRVSRVMLSVTRADGVPLPAGTAILRGDNEYFTAVAAQGMVLVNDMKADDVVYAELANGQRCTFHDVHVQHRADAVLFQQGSATCR